LKFEKDNLCVHANITKLSFKSIKDIMITHPLELIHMDLFGPTQSKTKMAIDIFLFWLMISLDLHEFSF